MKTSETTITEVLQGGPKSCTSLNRDTDTAVQDKMNQISPKMFLKFLGIKIRLQFLRSC